MLLQSLEGSERHDLVDIGDRGRRSAVRAGADYRGLAAHRDGRVRDAGLRDPLRHGQ